jgi:hypothetical protein
MKLLPRIYRLLPVALVMLLILTVLPGWTFGPAGPAAPASPSALDHFIDLPLVGKDSGPLPPIIPPTTNVLPPETTQDLISVSPDGATYTFSQMTPALASVGPARS